MPVNNNYEVMEYAGNGSGRIYNFPFRCFSLDNLVVEYIDVDGVARTLVRGSEYGVEGGLDNGGGMVTYPLDMALPALTADESLRISRNTPMEQSVDFPTYQQAIENTLDKEVMLLQEVSAERDIAMDKVDGFAADIADFEGRVGACEAVSAGASSLAAEADRNASAAVLSAEEAQLAAQAAALQAIEAIDAAENSSHGHANKNSLDMLNVDTAGSFALNVNGIEMARADLGNVDMSAFVGTDGTGADADGFRSLVGMAEVESDITLIGGEVGSQGSAINGLDSRVQLLEGEEGGAPSCCIAPQTIVKGAVGQAVFGCDPLAEHLEIHTSGSGIIDIKAGLQVAAAYKGTVVLSEQSTEDATLDIGSVDEGRHYIYADVGTTGSMSFGSTIYEPSIGMARQPVQDSLLPVFSDFSLDGYGTVSASSEYVYDMWYMHAWKAFTGTAVSENDAWSSNEESSGWLRYVADGVIPTCTIVGYKIHKRINRTGSYAPKDFTVRIGTGEVPDTVIDERAEVTGWDEEPEKTFMLEQPVKISNIKSIELNISASGSSTWVQVGFFDLIFEEAQASSKLLDIAMTSDTTPAPMVAYASSYYSGRPPYQAFNGVLNAGMTGGWQQNLGVSDTNPTLGIDLGGLKVVNKYSIQACSDDPVRTPLAWVFQGSVDGVEWDDLDTVSGSNSWSSSEIREYECSNAQSYRYYQIADIVSGYPEYTNVSEFQLYQREESDVYSTSEVTHYDVDRIPIKRVYLGECEIAGGAVVGVISYQHGTSVTLPVNGGENIGLNSTYYVDKPYLGYCITKLRLYAGGKWGETHTGINTSSGIANAGAVSYMTDGVLMVRTSDCGLVTSQNYSDYFTTELLGVTSNLTSAPAKVTIQRGY